jgi:hypothetical protein
MARLMRRITRDVALALPVPNQPEPFRPMLPQRHSLLLRLVQSTRPQKGSEAAESINARPPPPSGNILP